MTTLLQLRDRAKQESDNVGSTFITDAEWNSYIVASYQELYGLITQAFGNDYFTQAPSTGFTITTDGVNQFFALPTDFFKLLGVDLRISSPGNYVALKPFPFAERNQQSLVNSQIPMAGQVLRVFYVPLPTVPTIDASVVDGVNGWEEYIVIDAAIKALAKEESDVSVFMARKGAIIERLNSEVENRDAGSPATVADVRGRRSRGMRYRLNGASLWLVGNGQPGYGPWGDWGEWQDGGVW
jgi:hypothetical protein